MLCKLFESYEQSQTFSIVWSLFAIMINKKFADDVFIGDREVKRLTVLWEEEITVIIVFVSGHTFVTKPCNQRVFNLLVLGYVNDQWLTKGL